MAAPFHKDYFFLVLSNAITVDGTKAAVSGDMDVVLELITRVWCYEEDNGPSHLLDAKNSFGYNMLHYAVAHKNLPMVALLLNSNADCNCTTDDDGLYTSLHLAVMYYNVFLDPLNISVSSKLLDNPEHLKIIELLLEQGKPTFQGYKKLLRECCYATDTDVNAQDAAGDTALMLACKNGHLDLIKMLAERNQTNIHLTNQNGDTALHVACAQHLKEAIPILLACNASVLQKNNSGHTPIFIACKYGDSQILWLLLSHEHCHIKKLINDCDEDGNSPLMVAVQSTYCSKEVVELLLMLKSNLHIRNSQGNNLLHLFTPHTDPEVGILIIDRDQSLLHDKNCSRDQPLHVAAANGLKDLAFLFIERGADMEARNSSDLTPFMVSIAANHKEVIQMFVECGCEIYTHARHGKTVLEWSIENKYTELLNVLTDAHNSNRAMNLTLLDDDENSLIHASAKSPTAACLSVVLPTLYGEIFTNSHNKFGYTPLHTAIEHGNMDCVQTLIQSNAVVAVEDSDYNTPLHTACLNGHLKIVKFLLENTRADPEANNGVLGTPLSSAANFGHHEVVKYLLSRDVSTDGGCDKCTLQSTPLMLACKNGHVQVVKILLDHGVNVAINNDSGHNCLIEAILNKHKEVVVTLVTSKYWHKLMRFCTVYDDTTPMRLLIKQMPEVAEVVLYQCIIEEQHKEGDNKDNAITYLFDYLDDFQDPPNRSFFDKLINIFFKPVASVDTTFVNPLFSKEFYHHDDDNDNKLWGPATYTIANHPLMLMVVHQRTRLLTHPVVGSLLNHKWQTFGAPSFFFHLVFYIIFLALYTTLIFATPLPNGPVCRVDGCWSQWSEWSCCTAKCDDTTFVRVRTRECNNPTPSLGGHYCLGENRQKAVCDGNFTCNTVENGTFSFNTTIGMEEEIGNKTQLDCNICNSVPMNKRSRSVEKCEDYGLSSQEYRLLNVVNYIILSSSIVQLLIELLQIWRRKFLYLYDLENFVEIPLFVLTIVFCVGHNRDDCFCTTAMAWQVGAVALFLAWTDLLMFLKRLPFTGIPINILLNIVYTFATLAIIPALLILSFCLPFYLLLVRPDKQTPFSTPGRAFVKTLVMTTGEFEFDTLFLNTVENFDESDGKPLPTLYFPGAAYFLWIVFIIMMPVLFNNLLVGLAVGDTASERARATLIRLGLQVRLALEVEDSAPVLRRFWKKKMKTYTPATGGRYSFITRNQYNRQRKLVSGLKEDKVFQTILNTLQNSVKDPLKELKETVVKQMDDLEKGFMDKMQTLENLLQLTKKSISQIFQLQYEASANNESKEYNYSTRNSDARKMSIIDALKMSINDRQPLVGQNDALSLPHANRKTIEHF